MSVLLLFAIAPQVHAYIDPGTGSLLLQGLLAAIAGALVTAKFYWHRITAFFGLNKDRKDNGEHNNDAPDGE